MTATERPIRATENMTIQIDAKANTAVTDLIASFQVLDSANFAIVEGREPIGRIDAKKRVRFTLRDVPLLPGRYFVTVGLESGVLLAGLAALVLLARESAR